MTLEEKTWEADLFVPEMAKIIASVDGAYTVKLAKKAAHYAITAIWKDKVSIIDSSSWQVAEPGV